ncbi:YkgJ family cysteine cluster protein [Deltaproteobacteria bacterium]|nr:YkgJ family cysteine cluster protein [Deltaproteobacteria bacterium]
MKAFQCRMCGICCYGKGGISVDKNEILKISDLLAVSPEAFIEEYCENINSGISIRTGIDGYCIFYNKDKMCLIYPVKPATCSLWPFFPANVRDESNWNILKDSCPGINPNCSFEEFVKQSKNNLTE